MIKLVKMNEPEFQEYKTIMIKNYAKDQIKDGTWISDQALELAEKSIDKFLPEGLKTKDHYIFLIIDQRTNEKIGAIWFGNVQKNQSDKAHLCDLLIYEEYRHQGYGKKAMMELEKKAKELNFKKISLHVFGHNQPAIGLYNQMGYRKTNINMIKEIE